MIIGIDLGTTNSAVAYLTDDGPELIPNALGYKLTPSVVGMDLDGSILVGHAAQEFRVTHPNRCASLFKRQMGSKWSMRIGDRTFSSEELSSFVLKSLVADAAVYLKAAPSGAVVTVPAYFNDEQRTATMRAGELAGLPIKRIINEPTAAIIAYGFQDKDYEATAAVIDLGGGTFDVSLAEVYEGVVEIRASSGVAFLGGEDFTRRMASQILSSLGKNFEAEEHHHPLMVSRLIHECERTKRALTQALGGSVRVPNNEGEFDEDGQVFKINRDQFRTWIDDLLKRMEAPIHRCLGDSKISREDVDEVILVGGATRTPAVSELIFRMFGKEPKCTLDPDQVVAMGAAVQAGLLEKKASVEELVVTDVCPFTLGVEVCKQMGSQLKDGYFSPIIHRNTGLPVSREERLSTVMPNQRELLVKVFQGESRKISENLLLGELTLRGIPPGPTGQEVDIRFTYDLNGILEVEATIVATKKKANLVITRNAGNLSEQTIQKALKAVAGLKIHPREDTGNRFLLRRAERIFKECSLSERDALGFYIDRFEAALESQELDMVATCAKELGDLLDQLRPESDHG